jgi:Ras-related protein Rab-1A
MEAMYKIVLIGDSGAGKTSALLRFSDDVFTQHPMTTVGVDFKMKTLKIDKKVIKL